ncbi:MAG: hypothetical protein CM15mP39_05260 [Synechococcus sp.]|nr:MAG: hypothetical protein CM15mP39_05260 [Synechococcus sp.]
MGTGEPPLGWPFGDPARGPFSTLKGRLKGKGAEGLEGWGERNLKKGKVFPLLKLSKSSTGLGKGADGVWSWANDRARGNKLRAPVLKNGFWGKTGGGGGPRGFSASWGGPPGSPGKELGVDHRFIPFRGFGLEKFLDLPKSRSISFRIGAPNNGLGFQLKRREGPVFG